MSSKSARQLDSPPATRQKAGTSGLKVTILSFGYKQGPPPAANMMFDVRFLKNPYWVEELRPLTGLDRKVQGYVLDQDLAKDFLDMLTELLDKVLPRIQELKAEEFVIAFGCTGGQHRSTTLVEALADLLSQSHPHLTIRKMHRELDRQDQCPDDTDCSGSEGEA